MLDSVVIVGGGTAGWLVANHLAKALNTSAGGVAITLIESPDIPTVGVGEGTVPAMRQTLAHFGISETDFFRKCDATFKQSIKFVDWEQNPTYGENKFYHHIFDYPAIQPLNTVPYWLLGTRNQNGSFADSVSVQARICEAGLSPKLISQPEFEGISEYAYHLDAGKFSALLAENAVGNLGVTHVKANVIDAHISDNGYITSVKTDRGGDFVGDLFVDCSGFRALLFAGKFEVPFVDQSKYLFVDTALAMQVPYESDKQAIPSHTIATAKEAGWIWDIGLTTRRGTGHAYASQYISHEEAELRLREYVGPSAEEINCRRINMRIGYREKFWVKNCVAIGLSQGFVEPLEATGLLLFDATAKMLAELFPNSKNDLERTARLFNQRTLHAWLRVIDFIKLHYYLSQRDDSPFWIDNRKPENAPDSLLELLERWQTRPPGEYDFFSRFDTFNLDNYLYVLYGMNYQTDISNASKRFSQHQKTIEIYKLLNRRFDELRQQLEPNRQLLAKIKHFGLQRY